LDCRCFYLQLFSRLGNLCPCQQTRFRGAKRSSRGAAINPAACLAGSCQPFAKLAAKPAAILLPDSTYYRMAESANWRVITMLYDVFRAMDSQIVLAAEGDSSRVMDGFRKARKQVSESEKRFTRFSEDSELAQINRSAGNWISVSVELMQILQQAQELWAETGGLFDPSILPALKRAGYERSMDELRQSGSRLKASTGSKVRSDFSLVRIDPISQSACLPSGMQIDLGGIAKGWIAEQAARQLARSSTACAVSAGGDMVLAGFPEGETCWEIGLEDPRNPTQDLARLHVQPGAVVTSSIVKRVWKLGEQKQHHLINPRTGLPAETDWLSVTVAAPQAVQAEAYAKALLISGSRTASQIFKEQPSTAYLAVDQAGKLWGSISSWEVFNVKAEII
jgi:thiamine biosynthesis lipoprotein